MLYRRVHSSFLNCSRSGSCHLAWRRRVMSLFLLLLFLRFENTTAFWPPTPPEILSTWLPTRFRLQATKFNFFVPSKTCGRTFPTFLRRFYLLNRPAVSPRAQRRSRLRVFRSHCSAPASTSPLLSRLKPLCAARITVSLASKYLNRMIEDDRPGHDAPGRVTKSEEQSSGVDAWFLRDRK